MTDTEEQDLRSLAADLAGAEQSVWQPRCIARAFATPAEGAPVFTMQVWIDLDAASSPLLEGRLPETEEDLHAAVDAFGCGPVDLSAEEAVGLGLMLREAIEEAFAMSLPMSPPDDPSTLNSQLSTLNWLWRLAAHLRRARRAARPVACRCPRASRGRGIRTARRRQAQPRVDALRRDVRAARRAPASVFLSTFNPQLSTPQWLRKKSKFTSAPRRTTGDPTTPRRRSRHCAPRPKS